MATYLITGSNRGIGLEYCRQLKGRGDEVIATCRASSSELDDLGVTVETGVDVTSGSSVLKLKNKLTKKWYDGTIGIDPVDHCINVGFNTGYLHHIERCMRTQNYYNHRRRHSAPRR